MFTDITDIDSDELTSDLCIVGAGAAGISLAKQFLNSDQKVILLEAGGMGYEVDTQALYTGESLGLTYFPLAVARLRYFGGSTGHWGGACVPMYPIDLEKKAWLDHSGWPINYSALESYYPDAQKICGAGPFDYSVKYWADAENAPPLPFNNGVVESYVVQHSKTLRFGDVYREELKQTKNIQVVLHANVLDFATENTQGRVSAVHARNIEGKKLTVKAKFFVLCAGGLENPRLLLLSNKQFHGGLGNQHDLVGRYFMEHIYVRDAGKLMLPELRNMKLYERRKVNGINIRTGLGLSAETLRKHQLMNAWIGLKLKGSPTSHNEYDELDYKDRVIEDKYNSLSYLTRSFKNGEVPDDLWHHVSAAMNDIGARIERKFSSKKPVQQKPSTVIEFSTHSEQAPNPDSRVYLGNEIDEFGQRKLVLDWRLMEIDHASIRNTVELMARQFGATNIGRMMSAFNERDDVWTTPQSADENDTPAGNFHHMGTTKMHDNPKEGVVDANLKVHGLHNMYIAGSSVFPTSGFANPTLSIVALTCRLADHLKSKFT